MRFAHTAGLAVAAAIGVVLLHNGHHRAAPPAPVVAPLPAAEAPIVAGPLSTLAPPVATAPLAGAPAQESEAAPAVAPPLAEPVPLPRPKPRPHHHRRAAPRFPKQPPAPAGEPGCILLKCLPLFGGGR